MIKVAFTSIFYPLFMGRYMLEALLRRTDVEVWTAGPYTGRWIPWKGGMYLPQRYVFNPDMPLPFSGAPARISYKVLERHCPFEPDIWIEVSSTLEAQERPSKGVYVVIGADPHVLNYDKQRNMADVFFNMQRPYMRDGDHWLPYGYDPVWHAQTVIPAVERTIDAALVGLEYPDRRNLVTQLRGKGYNVRFEVGPCYDDARAIYHETLVGLNWSSREDTTARVFEIMAFGIAPVLNRTPDLVKMFVEDEHFLGFANVTEAVGKVEWCVANKEEAQQLGERARIAVTPHSWDARMEEALVTAGVLE